MQRRTVLGAMRTAAAGGWAALVGYPAARFLTAPLADAQEAASADAPFRRVERLARLSPGKISVAPVRGDKTDAWTVRRDVAIGRVFLRLEEEPGDDPTGVTVSAFNTICPHSGCQVTRATTEEMTFFCGCHDGRFGEDGELVEAPDYTHPSPRGLDELPARVEVDDATGEAWVAVAFQDFVVGTAEKTPRS
ncbi:MAG: Rieske 2Fe-2S domain-containing protein [Planctomycetota bacterium]